MPWAALRRSQGGRAGSGINAIRASLKCLAGNSGIDEYCTGCHYARFVTRRADDEAAGGRPPRAVTERGRRVSIVCARASRASARVGPHAARARPAWTITRSERMPVPRPRRGGLPVECFGGGDAPRHWPAMVSRERIAERCRA
jgi:hypothetical protein